MSKLEPYLNNTALTPDGIGIIDDWDEDGKWIEIKVEGHIFKKYPSEDVTLIKPDEGYCSACFGESYQESVIEDYGIKGLDDFKDCITTEKCSCDCGKFICLDCSDFFQYMCPDCFHKWEYEMYTSKPMKMFNWLFNRKKY